MSRRLLFRNQGGRGHIAATSMSLLMMSCATTTARDPDDPGWEVDVGQPDAAVVQPSTHSGPIPIDPCNGFYCASYPPGSSCMGAGAYSMCTGTRGACWSASGAPICAGSCVFTPRAVAETCNGQDDDCDNLVDENPSALCDDGLDCSIDVCFGTGGCYNSVPGSCQEIRRPTAESRVAPDGTWLMRRDNPRLTGRVFARVASQTGTAGSFTRTMNPVAGAIIGNGFANIEPGNPAAGWLYSENVAGAAAGFSTFRAPQVLLNVTGTTDIALYRFPAASGAAYEQVDFVRMQMAPEVLVLPVRVTVFTPTNGVTAWTQTAVRQILDPGQVRTSSYNIVSGTPNVVTAVSQELGGAVSPDDIWTQCNIQFRMVDYIPVTNATIASQVTNTCACGSMDSPSNPIGTFLASQPANVINLYIGGAIPSSCGNGDTSGVTCGPANSQIGASCASVTEMYWTHRSQGDRDAILLDQAFPFAASAQTTVAHELGHFLGLTHSPNIRGTPPADNSQCLPSLPGTVPPASLRGDTDGVPGLLMAPGSSGGTPAITPMQCARARCLAARWLETFTPTADTTARRVSVCAE